MKFLNAHSKKSLETYRMHLVLSIKHSNKWYIHKRESVLEDQIHKTFEDFVLKRIIESRWEDQALD